MSSARILSDAIVYNPGEFCVSDFSLFATMFWHEEPGTADARNHLYGKLNEELGELDDELANSPIEASKAIEEYGDVTFCAFALGNAFGLDMTIFVKDLWARQGAQNIRCRADQSGPPYVNSAIASGILRRYQATRYGCTFTNQPHTYDLKPGEGHIDQRTHQVELVANFLREPLTRPVQLLVGYTLADIWLGETKRITNTLDNDRVIALGMANNMSKIIGRVVSSHE